LNWHHYAIIATNGQANPVFYVDGVQQPVLSSEGVSVINLYPTTRPLQIGAQVDTNTGWIYYGNNIIDEISLYNRALSSNEVVAIYNAGSAGKCFTPVAPTIVTQPASQTVNISSNATFSVVASGTAPLSYQWYESDGSPWRGATNSTATVLNVQVGNSQGSYSYYVVVSNAVGSVTSSIAVLTLNMPPFITTLPAGQTVVQGSPVMFNVAVSGTTPLAYQWYKNNVALTNGGTISGVLTSNLTISAVAAGDAGTYKVIVTNLAGTASGIAGLIVNVPPTVTSQPVGQSVLVGSTVSFQGSAAGTGTLSYQWLKNNVPLADGGNVSGSATTNLVLSAVGTADMGNYSLMVTNLAGSTVSSNATLTVNALIYLMPTNTMSGLTVSVPVRLLALGQEVSMKFSLVFDPTVLTYAGVSDPTVVVNTNSASNGKVGLGFQNLAGYTAGDQPLVDVLFTANPVTTNTTSAIGFGDSPVVRQVIDGSFNLLTNINYSGSTISVMPAEYAADVYPRCSGDSTVDLRDWAQIGRFVAGLDTVSNADEMLRADCAPKGSPDGQLTVADWVQAGRYASGLDPLTIVTTNTSSAVASAGPVPLVSPNRIVQLVNVYATNGQTVSVPVNLVSVGNENAIGFNVAFNPAHLVFKGVTKGSAAAASQMYVNSNSVAAGRIGVALALGAGQTFTAGTNQLALLSFSVQGSVGMNVGVTFTTTNPVVQQVCDSSAGVLTANYVTSSVIVAPAVLPTLRIRTINGVVQVVWPQAYSNYTLQAKGSPAALWGGYGVPSANGTNLIINLPVTNGLQLFRLSE
jgi:hypothetical protein